MDALKEEIDKQQTLFNDLRAQKADAATLDEAKKRLADLKKQLGQSKAAAGVKGGGKKRERLLLKTAKVRPLRDRTAARHLLSQSPGHARLRPRGDVLS